MQSLRKRMILQVRWWDGNSPFLLLESLQWEQFFCLFTWPISPLVPCSLGSQLKSVKRLQLMLKGFGSDAAYRTQWAWTKADLCHCGHRISVFLEWQFQRHPGLVLGNLSGQYFNSFCKPRPTWTPCWNGIGVTKKPCPLGQIRRVWLWLNNPWVCRVCIYTRGAIHGSKEGFCHPRLATLKGYLWGLVAPWLGQLLEET